MSSNAETSSNALHCGRNPNGQFVLGIVADYLMKSDNFAKKTFGLYTQILQQQIQGQHYWLAIKNKDLVGYIAWACCSPEIAERYLETGEMPTNEDCNSGDTIMILTAHANSMEVAMHQLHQLRRDYPGHDYVYRRICKNNAIKKVKSRFMTPENKGAES